MTEIEPLIAFGTWMNNFCGFFPVLQDLAHLDLSAVKATLHSVASSAGDFLSSAVDDLDSDCAAFDECDFIGTLQRFAERVFVGDESLAKKACARLEVNIKVKIPKLTTDRQVIGT
jgi:hypothetical protein